MITADEHNGGGLCADCRVLDNVAPFVRCPNRVVDMARRIAHRAVTMMFDNYGPGAPAGTDAVTVDALAWVMPDPCPVLGAAAHTDGGGWVVAFVASDPNGPMGVTTFVMDNGTRVVGGRAVITDAFGAWDVHVGTHVPDDDGPGVWVA